MTPVRKADTTKTRAPFIPIAVAFACEACAAQGGNEIPSCSHSACPGPDSPEGCSHTSWTWEECEACRGTGLQMCATCDDEPATELSAKGERLCRACEEREEEEGCDDGSEPSDSDIHSESHRLMVEFYANRERVQ